MDDLEEAMIGLDKPRALPADLRESLSQLIAQATDAGDVQLAGIDAPRPLPAPLRQNLMELIVRRRAWPWRPLTLATLVGAVSVAALIIIGALALKGAHVSIPTRTPGPSSRDTGGPVAIAPPLPSPTGQEPLVPSANQTSSDLKEASVSGSPRPRTAPASYRTEVCFPEEQCPAVAGSSPQGSTSQSAQVQGRAPSPPRNVIATNGPSIGDVRLTWDAPEDSGSSALRRYAIYRQAEGQQEQVIAIVDAAVHDYADHGLTLGNYKYRLKVRNRDGISPFSEQVSLFVFGMPG